MSAPEFVHAKLQQACCAWAETRNRIVEDVCLKKKAYISPILQKGNAKLSLQSF